MTRLSESYSLLFGIGAMRLVFFGIVSLLAVLVQPVWAGNLSFSDGKGSWHSSGCLVPSALTVMTHNPERPADDLNARLMEHRQYVAATEDYMRCVSAEASHDAENVSRTIVQSAEAEIKKAQADVVTNAALLEKERSKFNQ